MLHERRRHGNTLKRRSMLRITIIGDCQERNGHWPHALPAAHRPRVRRVPLCPRAQRASTGTAVGGARAPLSVTIGTARRGLVRLQCVPIPPWPWRCDVWTRSAVHRWGASCVPAHHHRHPSPRWRPNPLATKTHVDLPGKLGRHPAKRSLLYGTPVTTVSLVTSVVWRESKVATATVVPCGRWLGSPHKCGRCRCRRWHGRTQVRG